MNRSRTSMRTAALCQLVFTRALLTAPLLAAGLFAIGLVGCADSGSGNGDGGTGSDHTISGRCPQGVDPTVDIATAITLAADTDATGYVCPRTDKDFYEIEVPAGHKLLELDLRLAAPTSPIQLGYLILKDAETVVGASPSGQNNQFKALHCIEPGTYYLQVQEDGNDAEDNKSAYTLRYTTRPDPDSGEPTNNTAENALTTDAPREGLISCTGDVDYYKVRVGANELFQLKLSTAQTTPVDFKYTVLRDNGGELEELMSGDFKSGARNATLLETLAAVPQANVDYYIRVEDLDGNDSDTDTPYTLEVARRAEPDSNDISGGRNDHPSGTTGTGTALTLASIGGGCFQGSITGRIASQADVDYFALSNPLGGARGTIEVDLSFAGSTEVDPAFALLYQTGKACSKDKCCRVIDDPPGDFCTSVMSCTASSSVCQEQGAGYCGDADCAGATPTATCAADRKCAGAVTCIQSSSRCGATQFFRNGQDGGRIVASHPLMHAGPWYVRVSDVGSDEYDYNATYTLRVKVCQEPDGAREPDNAYFARLIPRTGPCSGGDCGPIVNAEGVETGTIERYFDNGISRTDLGTLIPATGWSNWVQGRISHAHDTDHFSFANPCKGIVDLPQEACMLEAQVQVTGSDCPTGASGSGLEFVFTMYKGSGADSLTATGITGPTTYGYPSESDQCRIMLRGRSSNTLQLDVSDRNHNAWSPSCIYGIRFRVGHQGCPSPNTGGGPCAYDCTVPPCSADCYVP